MNLKALRDDFPALSRRINGKPILYLDNAATALKPTRVIDAVRDYYEQMPANVHRGLHKLSEEASLAFEQSHETVSRFINAKPAEISFTYNTTYAINTVMHSLLLGNQLRGKRILIGRTEHHANLVPWQIAAKSANAKLEYIELDPDYSISTTDLEKRIDDKTAIVSVGHISNTVAAQNDVKTISKIAHDHGALCLVDAAQTVPHQRVDVKKIGCDFLAFSGHKMCGPTGIGVLYGKEELLEKMSPAIFGGSMIQQVTYTNSVWNHLPDKFEAGTPHISGAIGLDAAVQYLQEIGMDDIQAHEQELTAYALKRFLEIKNIRIYGPKNPAKQGGIILFDHPKIECHEIALAVDEAANIAIRSGMHCAEPFVSSLNPKGVCRASFYLYNTTEEIDTFCEHLSVIANAFGK